MFRSKDSQLQLERLKDEIKQEVSLEVRQLLDEAIERLETRRSERQYRLAMYLGHRAARMDIQQTELRITLEHGVCETDEKGAERLRLDLVRQVGVLHERLLELCEVEDIGNAWNFCLEGANSYKSDAASYLFDTADSVKEARKKLEDNKSRNADRIEIEFACSTLAIEMIRARYTSLAEVL